MQGGLKTVDEGFFGNFGEEGTALDLLFKIDMAEFVKDSGDLADHTGIDSDSDVSWLPRFQVQVPDC